MVIDFKDIKKYLADIVSKLDHRFLNEIEPFTEDNPTAENISKYIYKDYQKILILITLKSVRLNFGKRIILQ